MHTHIPETGSSLRPDEPLYQVPQIASHATHVTFDEVARQVFQQRLDPITEPSSQREVEPSLSEAGEIEQRRAAVAEANSFLHRMTQAVRASGAIQVHSDDGAHRCMQSTWHDQQGDRWAFLAVSGEARERDAETGRRTIRPTGVQLMLIDNNVDNYAPTVLRTKVGDDHLDIRNEEPSSGNFPGRVWEVTDDTERKEAIQYAEEMIGLLYAGEATLETEMTRDLVRTQAHPRFFLPNAE